VGKRSRKRRTDVGVDVGEQPDRGGEHDLQVGAQLVGHRDPVGDQIAPRSHTLAQRGGGRGVDQQRAQPAPVGAHDIGQHVGVEAVVLVPGRAVAAAQVLELAGRDDVDDQPGRAQRVHDRAVGAFDPDLGHAGGEQLADQGAQPGRVMGDREPVGLLAVGVDDRDGVIVGGPVHPGGGSRRLGCIGDTHCCLLAVGAVGRHPVVPGRGSRSLTDRHSMVHSPVASRRVLGHRTSRNSSWTSRVERAGRWPGGDLRCARILDQQPGSDVRRVHQ
jgi:hypothetical protein